MNKIKTIIFDFDGVIAESVNVKTEAFAEIYRPYGDEIVKKVIVHHEANGGVSRFEKFKIYHERFLGKKTNEEIIQQLSTQFSKIVVEKVIKAPYVDGAYEFLSSNYKNYDFFISTGTPTDEMKIILKERGLLDFFKDVYGSPDKKGVHVKDILRKYNYQKKEVVFIGDALSDRNAARENGLVFIGRFTTSEEIKREKNLIEDFYDLERILEEM